jgi:hypothetical protein
MTADADYMDIDLSTQERHLPERVLHPLADEEGNFFKEHSLRHVLVLWEELFDNPAEEVIREQF